MNTHIRLSNLAVSLALGALTGCIGGGPSCGSVTGGAGTPSLEFTSVPPIGSTAGVKGQVLHVAPQDYFVAVYIYVPNAGGWWTKPYFADPETALNCDGTFSTEIITGGEDASATAIAAFLLPAGTSPPLLSGSPTLPQGLYSQAAATATATR